MARVKKENRIWNGRIIWTDQMVQMVELLAQGYSNQDVADETGMSVSMVQRYKKNPLVAEEIDRLTLMSDVALKAHRLRIAMQVIRQKINEDTGKFQTKEDLLDWLKYIQTETDGVRLDLSQFFAAISTPGVTVAGGEQAGFPALPAEFDDEREADADYELLGVVEDEV